jgi:hypothetical protein
MSEDRRRLARIETALARIEAAMVTKADLADAIAGVEQLRAMVQQQLGILDRLRALEEPPA